MFFKTLISGSTRSCSTGCSTGSPRFSESPSPTTMQ